MAEVDNPYAKYLQPSGGGDSAAANPYQKYVKTEPEVGTVEDVAKTAAPSLLRGTLALLTTPGSLDDLAQRGLEWGVNKFAPESKFNKFLKDMRGLVTDEKTGKNLVDQNSFFPTYETAKEKIEAKTGKLYDAKTPVGKGVQTGLEVLPSLAGSGPVGALTKATGAGVVSAGAGEAVKAASEAMPGTLPEWSEPVARGVGAVAGSFTPSGVRRAVTPNPMSPEQAAAVSALRARNPDFPMSAGQATESPRLMALEARSPRMADLPQRQEQAFTGGVMEEMGSSGLRTPANLARGEDVGQELGSLRRSNTMNQTEFNNLQRLIGQERRNLARSVGQGNTASLDEVRDAVRYGAQNNGTPVFDMPGARYEFMREDLQNRINSATNSKEKVALSNIRQQLDDSFRASLPDDAARARLGELEQQYANYNIIKNMKPDVTPEQTVTPKEVLSAVGKSWGNAAANQNRGTLPQYSRDAARVMVEHPKPNTEIGPLAKTLGAVGGFIGGGGAGHYAGQGPAAALLLGGAGAHVGAHRMNDVVQLLKNGVGRAISTDPMQGYLANQKWLPGAGSTAPDRQELIRLLMANPQSGLPATQ